MELDKNEFFRHATLRICSNPDIGAYPREAKLFAAPVTILIRQVEALDRPSRLID
ncbi:MAG: hypothetical protein GX433_16910 [Deltaproteobacteria bacterium]|jgi:hypothetical protein|nr:hypothetical protein [Deltaproteobacteria bacterium]